MSTTTKFQVGDTVRYTYIAVPDDETVEGEIVFLSPGGTRAVVRITKGSQRMRADSTAHLHTRFLQAVS